MQGAIFSFNMKTTDSVQGAYSIYGVGIAYAGYACLYIYFFKLSALPSARFRGDEG